MSLPLGVPPSSSASLSSFPSSRSLPSSRLPASGFPSSRSRGAGRSASRSAADSSASFGYGSSGVTCAGRLLSRSILARAPDSKS